MLRIVIKTQESDYVSYKIPENPNLWFEFITKENRILISLVEDIERDSLFDLFVYEPYKEFKYSDWSNVSILKEEFKREIIKNTQKLVHFIEVLNPQILKSKSIEELVLLLNKASSNFL